MKKDPGEALAENKTPGRSRSSYQDQRRKKRGISIGIVCFFRAALVDGHMKEGSAFRPYGGSLTF